MAKEKYNGEEDAERILSKIMLRQRWASPVRDALARALEKIVAREIDNYCKR